MGSRLGTWCWARRAVMDKLSAGNDGCPQLLRRCQGLCSKLPIRPSAQNRRELRSIFGNRLELGRLRPEATRSIGDNGPRFELRSLHEHDRLRGQVGTRRICACSGWNYPVRVEGASSQVIGASSGSRTSSTAITPGPSNSRSPGRAPSRALAEVPAVFALLSADSPYGFIKAGLAVGRCDGRR